MLTKNRRDFYRLHRANPGHAGIIKIRDDPDRLALADRVHAAIAGVSDLTGQLIRINRPNPPPVP